MTAFKDSQEASFRRVIRDTVRRGKFSKSERDVILAFVNHWFHHRSSTKGVVHPGRKKLAKRTNVCIKTVSRVLDLMRTHGAIVPIAHLEGLHGNATEYQVSVPHLVAMCRLEKSALRVNGGTNVPTRGRDKMSRRINNVVTFPSQKREA